MHRTEGLNHSSNMFTDGPPGTKVEQDWLNSVQEEIAYVIETASIVLKTASTDTRTQLHEAILALMNTTNITPSKVDDASSNVAAMQETTDPYPAAVESLATTLLGEIKRIRYLIEQITGEANWYIDPDTDLATLHSGVNTSLPAFSAYKSADQNNIAINSSVTVTWDSERFDQGADFAANVFTAPVTGKYQFNVVVDLEEIDTGATSYIVYLITSNKTYRCYLQPKLTADFNGSFQVPILADMDAADTAYVAVYQTGGVQQTDIMSAYSSFSGFLAC